jgi:hypothetical protein
MEVIYIFADAIAPMISTLDYEDKGQLIECNLLLIIKSISVFIM